MNHDFLLLAGACVVAWAIGIELGCKVMATELSKPLNDLAVGLAELHSTHADAKEKKAAHDAALIAANQAKAKLDEKLESHIQRLRSQYGL